MPETNDTTIATIPLPTPRRFVIWTRVDGQPAVRRRIELGEDEEYDDAEEFCTFENLQPQEEFCYTENPDEPELLARRFWMVDGGYEVTWAELAEANCDDPEALEWMFNAPINAEFPGGAAGVTVRRVQDLAQFLNIHELTPELAAKIRDAFGSCTLMYECETVPELVESFNEMRGLDASVDLAYWLDIELSVEGAGNTPSEWIPEIKQRLAEIVLDGKEEQAR